MKEGENFPEFELVQQDEKKVSLEDLKGSPFVVFAYPRADTPGCTKEACSVRDNFSVIKDRGVKIYGISTDKPAKNKKFAEKYNLQYDLLCDPDAKLLTKLGAYGEKNLYGKKSMGTFRYTFISDKEGKIRKVFKKVDTSVHGEEILSALDNLGL